MTIQLSQSAAERVKKYLSESGRAVGLRLAVKTTGCSGWAYVVQLTDAIEKTDHVCETEGVKIVIDADSLPYLDGTRMDYIRQGLSERFSFANPKAAAECGCGESFTV